MRRQANISFHQLWSQLPLSESIAATNLHIQTIIKDDFTTIRYGFHSSQFQIEKNCIIYINIYAIPLSFKLKNIAVWLCMWAGSMDKKFPLSTNRKSKSTSDSYVKSCIMQPNGLWIGLEWGGYMWTTDPTSSNLVQ